MERARETETGDGDRGQIEGTETGDGDRGWIEDTDRGQRTETGDG